MLLVPTFLCPKSWKGMSGDETTRFCSYCKKHVHNLETMTVSARLALLSSPAASICSRYKVAIRRPAKGKEASYYAHLAKHGAGVALAGSVLLVLWEMQSRAEKERFYRAAAPRVSSTGTIVWEMPKDNYCERHVYIVGDIALPPPGPPDAMTTSDLAGQFPAHVDLKLDPVAVDKLVERVKPALQIPSGFKP